LTGGSILQFLFIVHNQQEFCQCLNQIQPRYDGHFATCVLQCLNDRAKVCAAISAERPIQYPKLLGALFSWLLATAYSMLFNRMSDQSCVHYSILIVFADINLCKLLAERLFSYFCLRLMSSIPVGPLNAMGG
jgi:hypothetical protein